MIKDEEGRDRVKATTSWLVLDLNSRSMVRDPNLVEEGTICTENAVELPADRVRMPREIEAEPVHEHIVGYSDVDMLGHANNAMYMQWAMDAVDYDIASTRPVKEVTINFNHETKAGDVVALYKSIIKTEDGRRVYVEGKVGDTSAFCVEIIF